MSDELTRRSFLARTAPTVVGSGLVAANLTTRVARSSPLGANDRIRVGVIGTGGRGRYLVQFVKPVGAEVTAVCDLHKEHMERAYRDLTDGKAKKYHDYRKLLEDKDVDVVIIATNGQWKALPAIEACQAGKDVYLEKPVATSIGEGRAVVQGAKKYERLIQMGTQQHSWKHYREAVEIVRSGRLGDIATVHVWDLENFHPGFGSFPDGPPPEDLDWDSWVGPSPKRAYNPLRYSHHYWFFDYGGSWPLEWGVHHYDIVHWAMGVDAPTAATATGGRYAFRQDQHDVDWPDTFHGTCAYPAGPVAKNGFLMQYTFRSNNAKPIEGRLHGKAFYGSDGTLIVDRTGYQLVSENRDRKPIFEGRTVTTEKTEHEVVQDHLAGFLQCVRDRQQPEASIDVGHKASNPGHLMNIAWRVGRPVRWNAQTEQIEGDEKANRLVIKVYRAPWKLPTS
jgi:predicted dehydrogenase